MRRLMNLGNFIQVYIMEQIKFDEMIQVSHQDRMDEALLKMCKKVYAELGLYHRERTYQNALEYELIKVGHKTIKEYPLKIIYDNQVMNTYFIDIVIGNLPIEIKVVKNMGISERYQIRNYMMNIGSSVGYLINFGYHELEVLRFNDVVGEMVETELLEPEI